MGLREDQIAQAKAMKTPDGERMFTDAQIEDHVKQLDLARTFSRSVMATDQPQPPSQILRSMAQGLTLNTADEIEAYLKTLGGGDREAALRDIRINLKNYQEASPIASTTAEIVGSLPLAYIGAPPARATLLRTGAQLAGVGAVMGAGSGFGRAEGDTIDRLVPAAVGAATGAAIAPLAYFGIRSLGTLADPVIDFATRKFGDKFSKSVETEIRRITEATRLTPDEIVQRVANGEPLSENQSLLSAVRLLYAQGGQPSNILRESLGTRPAALRENVISDIQKTLTGDIKDPNVLRGFKASEVERKDARNQLYEQAYESGGIITPTMLSSLKEALKRAPDSVENINALHLAKTGQKPFFKIDDAGEIQFVRAPNIQDMETARRGIQTTINNKFKSGQGDVGTELKPFEKTLRDEIDKSSQKLKDARITAASNKTTTESFDSGKKAFGKSPDEIEIEFQSVMAKGTDAVSAYRAGLMDQLRSKMASGGKTTMMSKLEDANTKEGAIFRIIYPQDKVDNILKLASTAAQSQRAATKVMGGSDTFAMQAEAKQQGINISGEEISSVLSGNAFSAARILGKWVGKNEPNLTPEQKQEVVRILISTDKDLIKKALTDNSKWDEIQKKVRTIGSSVTRISPGLFNVPAQNLREMILPDR
jgi:hypothetical protein